jgi:hypothetical protein
MFYSHETFEYSFCIYSYSKIIQSKLIIKYILDTAVFWLAVFQVQVQKSYSKLLWPYKAWYIQHSSVENYNDYPLGY